VATINGEEIKRLNRELAALTTEIAVTRSELKSVGDEFKLWRETRCDDHHNRLQIVEEIQKQQNAMIWKAAGAVAFYRSF